MTSAAKAASRGSRWSTSRASRWPRSSARAHERGVLHRDLKTANIACGRELNAKILDFGLARRLSTHIPQDTTRPVSVVTTPGIEGTLAYMAPEVIRGQAQDERSDLWALGVVLFEMLTGAPPFTGRNTFDLAAEIAQGPPVQLRFRILPGTGFYG